MSDARKPTPEVARCRQTSYDWNSPTSCAAPAAAHMITGMAVCEDCDWSTSVLMVGAKALWHARATGHGVRYVETTSVYYRRRAAGASSV